jgi:hypothetical protein
MPSRDAAGKFRWYEPIVGSPHSFFGIALNGTRYAASMVHVPFSAALRWITLMTMLLSSPTKVVAQASMAA